MPIIRDYQQVKEIYAHAAEKSISLPAFCLEDRVTLEAILAATLEISQEIGVKALPVIVSWTARYHLYAQAEKVSKTGNARLGCHLLFSDLEIFMGEESPYRHLLVMPNLDHGVPWVDGDIMFDFHKKFASIMCDASEKSLDENIEETAKFVDQVKGKVVVEGAVDEISSPEKGLLQKKTSVEDTRKFIQKTGVDIIVPNVGTEHRASVSAAHYDSELTRKITDAVGKIVCLHGSSSLKPEDLPKVPQDGVVKVNIYTGLARAAGRAVVQQELENLGNVFNEEEIKSMIAGGVLGKKVLEQEYGNLLFPLGPKLDYLTNTKRTDAWVNVFKARCKDYMYAFNYRHFAD